MKIALVGLGKLGLPSALFLASKLRQKIKVFDQNKIILNEIKKGEINIEEKNSKFYKNFYKYLQVNHNLENCIENTNLCIITVPTPSNYNGSFSNKYIKEVVSKIGKYLSKKNLGYKYYICIASTVSPNSINKFLIPYLEKQFNLKLNKHFVIIYQPYFVALGDVFAKLENPDFILCGHSLPKINKEIKSHFSKIYKNSINIEYMSILEAEITKLLVNSYITTKISFSNYVKELSSLNNINSPVRILAAMGKDRRIGCEAFRAGGPFSGPCFPRDNFALKHFEKKSFSKRSFANLSISTNNFEFNKFKNQLKYLKSKKITKIGFFGLSYKSNTNSIEESIAIKLIDYCEKLKIKSSFYDPYIMNIKNYKKSKRVKLAKHLIEKNDLVFISYPDTIFKKIEKYKSKTYKWDIWNLLKKDKFTFSNPKNNLK